MKEISRRVNEVAKELIYLILTIVMRVFGKIMVSMARVNCIGTITYFSKENSRTVLSMVWENISMRMETILRVFTLKIKKGVMEVITSLRAEFYNRNSTLFLLRYPS